MTVYAWMIEMILIAIVIELLAGMVLLRRAGRQAWIAPFAWFLASGAALMVGVQMALTGEHGPRLAATLLVSLVGHLLAIYSAGTALRRGR